MKRFLTFLLFIVLCLVSCTKDIEPIPVGPDGEQKLSADQIFWNVVGKLVGMDQITPEYQGKTFTPIIGSPDNGDESVRIVGVNSLAAAVGRYNSLVGSQVIDVNTSSYTWNNKEVGTLVWNKGDGNTAWGTVDVSIPAVPSLQKIIYRSPEQGDVNGSVGDNGSAYYRFGDVISRTRPASTQGGSEFPAITEYWICVRPAFGPEGKGDSHWVSLSPLPRENVWPYNEKSYNYGPYVGSNNYEYGMPTSLGDDLEWLQDLNEMLYAIVMAGNVQENWFSNATNYAHDGFWGPDGLPVFNDFHHEWLHKHNDFFWQNVKIGWQRYGLFEKLLGTEADGTRHDMTWVRERVKNGGDGIAYLHTGYSWWVSLWDNSPELYEAVYGSRVTSDHMQLNCHSVSLSTVEKQVTDPDNTEDPDTNIPFNVKTECSEQRPFVVNRKLFGDADPRFIYRYKTGQELAKMGGGTWNPQFALPGFQEVYRYYGNGGFEPNHILTMPPETTEASSNVIDDKNLQNYSDYSEYNNHYQVGDVYKDENGHKWFVVKMAGGPRELQMDAAPFSELISFEGLTASANKSTVTNVPTLDYVIRAYVSLFFLYQESVQHANGTHMAVFDHIRNEAKVDLTHLMTTKTFKNWKDEGIPCRAVSIAYSVPGSDKQHLVRLLEDHSDEVNNRFFTTIWSRYPKNNITNPDNHDLDKYKVMKREDFRNDDIYLQDIASQDFVTLFADDLFAKGPFADDQSNQNIRNTPDSKANDVTNYYYNINTWGPGTRPAPATQPLSLWNEPVLMFSYTAVYDRGSEYSTKTVDGHTLTLLSTIPFNNYTDDLNDQDSDPESLHSWQSAMNSFVSPDFYHLNGEGKEVLTWRQAWIK